MIIYRNTKGGFVDDVRNGVIGRKVLDAFVFNGIHHNNPAEYRSWENSLRCMRDAIDDTYIADDCRVAIEYKLPVAGKRIDFLIEGLDEADNRNIVVVELKQWEQSEYTGSPEIVKTYVAGGLRPEEEKYISLFPVYTIRAACGYFGDREPVSQLGWMRVTGHSRKDYTKFIVQAVGHSMEPRINDGDYCLFETYKGGSREGKIVLAEHHGEVDEDYEGAYSIKEYHSKKTYNEFGEWEHESIELRPKNPSFHSIFLDAEESDNFRIIGEFLETIDINN